MEITIAMNEYTADTVDKGHSIPLREVEDSSLVAYAKTGDYSAFEELVKRYRNDVFGLSYHYLRNREEAWDISQEVFIKAHRAITKFRGDASFKTWILRITANRCKDFFKKRKLKTVSVDEPAQLEQFKSPTASPDEALASSELGHSIKKALDTLSEKHKLAFVLRELEGQSYEDMSKIMECSLGTVMSRLHHARKKLQQSLITMGVMEDR